MSYINQANTVPDNMDIFLAVRNQVICPSRNNSKNKKTKIKQKINFL